MHNLHDPFIAGERLSHSMSISVHGLARYWTPGLWSGNCGPHWSSAEMAATERKSSYRITLQVSNGIRFYYYKIKDLNLKILKSEILERVVTGPEEVKEKDQVKKNL